jgi:hypothetical protein
MGSRWRDSALGDVLAALSIQNSAANPPDLIASKRT